MVKRQCADAVLGVRGHVVFQLIERIVRVSADSDAGAVAQGHDNIRTS